MAKSVYKIPSSLNRSTWDHEIALSGAGFQSKPLALKVILFWVGSFGLMMWTLFATPLKHADWWLLMLIGIWWILTTAFLGRYTKTKELSFRTVPALLNFLPKASRNVVTRTSSDPSAFYSIVGIDTIDENGYITFTDGTVGQAYLVVGSASVLVFDKDKIDILNRVDSFYRKIDTSVELMWMTTKEPQRVYRQLANLELQNRQLESDDPELQELLEERYSILTGYVGDAFTSIHQYLVLKGDSLEALRRAHTVVRSESEESSLMIKQLTQLNGADTVEMFSTVYSGRR